MDTSQQLFYYISDDDDDDDDDVHWQPSNPDEDCRSNDSGARSMSSGEFRREIIKYRLKYLFRQPCSLFCRNSVRRIPSGKQVFLIFVLLWLEQVAYSFSSDLVLTPLLHKVIGNNSILIIRIFVIYIAGNLPFPIVGWIADACVGQYRMIHISMWILWFGYAAMALLYSICKFVSWSNYLLPLCFITISIGSAGFRANAIPFGANLINYKTSEELSSYFYYYYWIRNLGFLVYFTSSICIEKKSTVWVIIMCMIPVVCISLALCLNVCLKKWLIDDKEKRNPYKNVIQVLSLAARIKRPVHRSAFSFSGASPPSRINLTKKVHGGKFSNEDVEDVKTFLRLLLVSLSIMSGLVLFMGVSG